MIGVEFKELPEETSRWLGQAQAQIASLRAMVDEHEQLRVDAKSAADESDRLRGLVTEHETLRDRLASSERLGEQLRAEVDRLGVETRQYREREEVADSLTTVLSELLLRLRPQMALAGDHGRLTSRFEQALLYAKRSHASRTRKDTQIPYIAHPLGVTAIVLENGGDEDEAIAALLHDAVDAEGSVTTLEDIRCRFGNGVARIVAGCSDSDWIPTLPWRERKARYLERLRQAPLDVLRVSAANTLHDARVVLTHHRASGESPSSRLGGANGEIGWYYRALVDLLRTRGATSLADELGRVADDIEIGPTRAARPPMPRLRAAGRSTSGLFGIMSVGVMFFVAAILVWALFHSAVGVWWAFVRPLLGL